MEHLLVAGSRTFDDSETFGKIMQENLHGETVIIEGGALGVDTMAREYAIRNGLEYVEIRPDWKRYGRAAGPKRNDAMTELAAEHGGRALFFWDGQSKGTAQCIRSAKKRGLAVKIWNTAECRYTE